MSDISDAFSKSPILERLYNSRSKRCKEAVREFISSHIGVEKKNLESVLISDPDKYVDTLSNIEHEHTKFLLSFSSIVREGRESFFTKRTLMNGGVYPIIISIIVAVAFLMVTNLVFSKEVPVSMKESLCIIVGALASNFTNVVQFFLGSSLGNVVNYNTLRDTLDRNSSQVQNNHYNYSKSRENTYNMSDRERESLRDDDPEENKTSNRER